MALAARGSPTRAHRAHRAVTMRTLVRTLGRTAVLQIDSVNVLQRAHYMPLFSRMGPYDVDLLRRAAGRAPRRLVEYWAHVAAFMPVELWPAMQHRMRHYREHGHDWVAHRPRASAGRRCSPRSGPRAGDGPRPRRRAAARSRALGLELVGDQEGAGVPVRRRRAGGGRAQLPVRAALRPARAGDARARARRRPSRPGGGRARAGPAGGRGARRRQRAVPARLLPDGGRRQPAGRARPGRGRGAAAGQDRGLGPAGVPAPRRHACRDGSRRGRC